MLKTPIVIAGKTIVNRVVLQPMEGCDCTPDGAPGELTRRKYLRAAESGAGVIWLEATAVCPEGRTNTRQMMITEENAQAYKALVSEIRETAEKTSGIDPVIIMQLTHSGRQSIVPMTAYRHPLYETRRPAGDENVVSDAYLDSLPEKYARTAKLAAEAGIDGVDVKSCHGYLMQELLSAFTRPGKYGGAFENRAKLYIDTLRAVKAVIPSDMLLTARLSVSDMIPHPWGFGTDSEGELDLREPDLLMRSMYKEGVQILNVTLGNPYYNPHVNRPFRKGAYVPPEKPETGLKRFETVEKHIKTILPELPVVGSGLSYYRKDALKKAEELLAEGTCDLAGFGRLWLAYPGFYRDYLSGTTDARKFCVTCSRCTELMRGGRPSGCAVFDDEYKKIYEEMKR